MLIKVANHVPYIVYTNEKEIYSMIIAENNKKILI